MGPIEVMVVGFPKKGVGVAVLPELRHLVDDHIIRVVDGVVVQKSAEGEVRLLEFNEADGDEDIRQLAELFDETLVLLAEDDAEQLGAGLQPDSSAAMLVFEHTWATPLRDAIVGTGGSLLADFRVPYQVVDEILAVTKGETR